MTHYELLGVDRDATPTELARAYRRLARQHHPDRNGHDAVEATKRMVAINEAFDVLSDPVRRFDYNRSLDGAVANAEKQPTAGTDSGEVQRPTARPKPPPADDPVRRARREAKERAAEEARRRGYRDPSAGRMDFRAPE